jgi:hypothetical protein
LIKVFGEKYLKGKGEMIFPCQNFQSKKEISKKRNWVVVKKVTPPIGGDYFLI